MRVVTVQRRTEGSGRKGREGDSFGIELGIGVLKKVGRGKRTSSVVREEEVVIVQSVDDAAGLLPGDRVMERASERPNDRAIERSNVIIS